MPTPSRVKFLFSFDRQLFQYEWINSFTLSTFLYLIYILLLQVTYNFYYSTQDFVLLFQIVHPFYLLWNCKFLGIQRVNFRLYDDALTFIVPVPVKAESNFPLLFRNCVTRMPYLVFSGTRLFHVHKYAHTRFREKYRQCLRLSK